MSRRKWMGKRECSQTHGAKEPIDTNVTTRVGTHASNFLQDLALHFTLYLKITGATASEGDSEAEQGPVLELFDGGGIFAAKTRTQVCLGLSSFQKV